MARRSSKINVFMIAVLGVLVLGGCTTTGYPVAGMWTQDVRVSLDGKIASGSKEGKACATSWMGVFAMGDASVETAALNGGITRVKSVEALINARIIMGTFCTERVET